MSNQNNTMQKLDLQSNVNLNRFKDNIDGALRLNNSTMPVVGEKFNPMLSEYETDKEYIYENGDNKYYYGRKAPNEAFGVGIKNKAFFDWANTYDTIGIAYYTSTYYGIFVNNGNNKVKYISWSDKTETVYNNMNFDQIDNKFYVHALNINIYVLSDEKNTYVVDIDTQEIQFISSSGLVGVSYIPTVTNGIIAGVKMVVITTQEGTYKYVLKTFNTGSITSVTTGFESFIYIQGYKTNTYIFTQDLKAVAFDLQTQQFTNITVTSSMGNLYTTKRYLDFNLTNPTLTDFNEQRNGFIYSQSVKVTDGTNFKVVSCCPFFWKVNGNMEINSLTSIENNTLVDNTIYADTQDVSPLWMQGCNILMANGLGYNTINQNFISLDSYSYPSAYRLNNLKWVFYDTTTTESDILEPKKLSDSIIFSQKMLVNKNGLFVERDYLPTSNKWGVRDVDVLLSYHFYGNFQKVFSSVDDWMLNSRYWVIGSNLVNEDVHIPQLAPVLSASWTPETVPDVDGYFTNFFIQKSKEDATLYNKNNKAYVAPTDEDFFIPLMPTDKVIGSIFDSVLIQRADGSKAELTKYNNKFYPVYNYSTISEHVEYSFVCQGQVYNIINDIICDSTGTGICDVSDQQFIGCNGIFALFYNERSKRLYQFGASNILEEIIQCDNIKNIIQSDLSNTNDEIYILYMDYDGFSHLVCIESDGQIYEIVKGEDVVKFQVGNKGIFIWFMEDDELKCYTYRLMVAEDTTADRHNFIETNYFGTDEFKLMNVDRIFLRFVPTAMDGTENSITVNLSMLTLDGEVNEQYEIDHPSKGFFRIAPRQKQCLGIKVRLDGLDNYTLSALSIGVTDDCNIVTNNRVENKRLDVTMFD